MAIDYSLFAIPKSRVKALDKADKVKAIEAQDKAENAKAKKRANGRCEVREVAKRSDSVMTVQCINRDTQTHHLIYGIGRKNKGNSILAGWKIRVCDQCHADINAKVLKPTTAEHDASTVRYWRAK